MPPIFPPPPALQPLARVYCQVGALVTLGPGHYGERRYVPLTGGRVEGPALYGEILDGGVDWQIARADGVLEIAAHYVVRAEDGGLIEVRSEGLRHGSAEVMAALGRGEALPREAYYFRTLMRFQTGAPAWLHLNKWLALACGERQASQVVLDVYRID